jgi:hypothetical protein
LRARASDSTRIRALVVGPTGCRAGGALFNLDWITLVVMVIIALIGALYFFIARPDRKVGEHVHDGARGDGSRAAGAGIRLGAGPAHVPESVPLVLLTAHSP